MLTKTVTSGGAAEGEVSSGRFEEGDIRQKEESYADWMYYGAQTCVS